MENTPTWLAEEREKTFPPLSGNASVDVAVIGGGITGVMTAYTLAMAGKRVALLEEFEIGGGETGYTTAFLTCVIDAPLEDLVAKLGRDRATAVWRSGQAAIEYLSKTIERKKISCEFIRCPASVYAARAEDAEMLQRDAALARELGFPASFARKANGQFQHGCFKLEDQGKFHPRKFVIALADRARERGAMIFESTRAESFSAGEKIAIRTSRGVVTADALVVATHAPFANFEEVLSRLTPTLTFALEAAIPERALPEMIAWDTEHPYHYFRIDDLPAGQRLILGGGDVRLGAQVDSEEKWRELGECAKNITEKAAITRRWSGQIYESADGLPFIGRSSDDPRVYLATGFSGNGMTFGTLSALIISDAILEKKNDWAELYRPNRA